MQKEVAERIARSAKESILSLSVKAYGAPKYAFTVPAGAFVPAPKVDSAVLRVTGISRSAFSSSAHEERFFALLHAGFGQKRKRLAKNLEAISSRGAVVAAFESLDLSPDARAEDVPLATWLTLSSALSL